jgi:hypothetical protein
VRLASASLQRGRPVRPIHAERRFYTPEDSLGELVAQKPAMDDSPRNAEVTRQPAD